MDSMDKCRLSMFSGYGPEFILRLVRTHGKRNQILKLSGFRKWQVCCAKEVSTLLMHVIEAVSLAFSLAS
jgi:hypothetical protein